MDVKEKVKVRFNADRIAEMVKVLDRREAGLLLFVFAVYRDELIEDLNVIHEAIKRSDFEGILELLRWYESRCMDEIAKVPLFNLPAKEELRIFNYLSFSIGTIVDMI